MDSEEAKKRKKSKKSEGGEGENKEHHKSKSKKKKKESGKRSGENDKKKKTRKSSRSRDRHGDANEATSRRMDESPSGGVRATTKNGSFRDNSGTGRTAGSTVVPNLANLVGDSDNEFEEPLKQSAASSKSTMAHQIELMRERDNRKREASRPFTADEQSHDSSAPVAYSAMITSRDSSRNSIFSLVEQARQNSSTWQTWNGDITKGAPAASAGSQHGRLNYASNHGVSEVDNGSDQKPGAFPLSGSAPRGKSASRLHSDARVGAVSVSSAAPRRKSGVSVSSAAESYDSRVGAVSVSSAAPQGKYTQSASARTSSPSSRDPRVGAIAVAGAAPQEKSYGRNASVASSVGAVAMTGPPPQGKRRSSASSAAEASVASNVGALAVAAPAPRGKGGVTVFSGADGYNPTASSATAVGAVPVSGPAPRGKRGPSLSSGSETYEPATRVGAVSVSSAAPQGKRRNSAGGDSTASDNRYDRDPRVGASAIANAAPQGKRPEASSGVGAVSVAAPAISGKGGLAVLSGAESYGAESQSRGTTSNAGQETRSQHLKRSSITSMSSRDSSSQVGAQSVSGPPSTSKASRGSAPSLMEGAEVYEDMDEVSTGAFAARGSGKRKGDINIAAEDYDRGASRRSSVDTATHSETASQKGRVSFFPTSDLYASISSLQETRTDNKGRVSQFPGEENYEEDIEEQSMRKISRRTSDASGPRKPGYDPGPSYSESGDSYERDNSVIRDNSFRSGLSSGSQSDSVQRRRRGSTGAFFISGQTVEERERGSITAMHQESSNAILDAEVTPSGAVNEIGVCSDDLKRMPWYRSRTCCLVTLALVIVGATLGVVLPLVVFNGGNDGSSNNPTQSPVKPLDPEKQDAIRSILFNVTDSETLDNSSSPQNAAFLWIVRDDSLSTVTPGAVSPDERETVLSRYALATFFYATSGTRWISSVGWLNGELDECNWEFLRCTNQQIAEIDTGLQGNNLIGSIPSEIKELTSLVYLSLPSNRLTEIHPDFVHLPNLDSLDLHSNAFEGMFPSIIYQMTSLRLLDLGSNKFTGSLPSQLALMTNLARLSLGINSFSGTLTNELTSLNELVGLDLSVNRLAGDFHGVISGLTSLMFLTMENNQFTGRLDGPKLLTYPQLTQISLAVNSLSGTIPTELGSLNSLGILSLDGNRFTGTIPSALASVAPLELLYLDGNMLTGSIPVEICDLPTLTEVSVDCEVACTCDVCIQQCGGSARSNIFLH